MSFDGTGPTGGATTYHHADHLSTRVETNASGVVSRTFGQFPFGEVWYETGTANKWKFTSYERDNESGLDYAVFRYNSPRLGRFTSPDPLAGSIRSPQSLNRYAYVGNDPINKIDPLGLKMFPDWWGGSLWGDTPFFADFSITFIDCVSQSEGFINPPGQEPGGVRVTVTQCDWETFDFNFLRAPEGGGGGGGGGLINKRLQELKDLLDPKCLEFLGGKGIDTKQYIDDLIKFDAVGQARIEPRPNPDGTISIATAQSPGLSEGQATTLNTIGAFFNSSYEGSPLTTDRGKIEGGTKAAQLFILLHELGHNTGVLKGDFQNQEKIDRNDKLLEKKCKQTIKSFSK